MSSSGSERFQFERLAGAGVGECEFGGVEEVAVERDGLGFRIGFLSARGGDDGDLRRGSVEGIADDRMANRRQMHADLVGAAGFDADGDERERAEARGDTLDDSVVRDGSAGSGVHDGWSCGYGALHRGRWRR